MFKYLGVFLLGCIFTLIILFISFNIWVNTCSIGKCTLTDLEGNDIIYKTCQGVLILTKEQNRFFSYTRINIYRGN